MLADEKRRSFAHAHDIEREMKPPDAACPNAGRTAWFSST